MAGERTWLTDISSKSRGWKALTRFNGKLPHVGLYFTVITPFITIQWPGNVQR